MTNVTRIYQTTTGGANPIQTGVAHQSRSNKYVHVDSLALAGRFYNLGFQEVGTSYGIPRKEHRQGFQKHIQLFTRDDLKIGDDYLQIALTNSHDGSTSVGLDMGIFRTVCANGLFVGDKAFSFRFRHTGNVLDRVDQAVQILLDRAPQVAADIAWMKEQRLNSMQIKELTRLTLLARLGHVPERYVVPTPKRLADDGTELWKVFNTLQERAIKGGLSYADTDQPWKRTRKITNINRVIKLNKELWNAAKGLVA